MQLELTSEAATVLAQVLEHALGDAREEVYKTDAAELKTALRAREAIIESLLQRVKGVA